MIQEVAVVGNRYYSAWILVQVLFKPVDRLGIEVVGGLVKQQYIRLLKEKSAQCHATAFATAKRVYFLVVRWALQGIHGSLQFAVNIPGAYGIKTVL